MRFYINALLFFIIFLGIKANVFSFSTEFEPPLLHKNEKIVLKKNYNWEISTSNQYPDDAFAIIYPDKKWAFVSTENFGSFFEKKDISSNENGESEVSEGSVSNNEETISERVPSQSEKSLLDPYLNSNFDELVRAHIRLDHQNKDFEKGVVFDSVNIYFYFYNASSVSIIGVSGKYKIKNVFKKVVFEDLFELEVNAQPGALEEATIYYSFNTLGDKYKKLMSSAIAGSRSYSYEFEIESVVLDNGTVLKRTPKSKLKEKKK